MVSALNLTLITKMDMLKVVLTMVEVQLILHDHDYNRLVTTD